MADVITVSSSEDESAVPSPPRKRIKPTPVLDNLPQISITKVTKTKPQTNKQAVVVVCSDDDDDDDEDDGDEEVTYVAAADIIEFKSDEEQIKDKKSKICENEVNIVDESINSDIEEVKDTVNDADKELEDSSINSDIEEVKDTVNDADKELEDSCEIINEDSCEESSGKENRANETSIKDGVQPCSSGAAGKSPNTVLLDKFVKILDDQIKEGKYIVVKNKYPQMWNFYNKCQDELGDSTNFKNMLLLNIQKAEKSVAHAVISFNDIFQYLTDITKAESIEVDDRDSLIKLKKLEKTIRKLTISINQIGEQEIDFDDEEDSSYMKLDRYIARLDKLYKKYCKLLKKNPFSGRIIYSKLDFVDSEYNEINRAISKKYKNNNKFPSYYEMEKFIEKIVKDNNLGLSESKIKSESVHCFKKLGELLQTRRRKDLYDSHHLLIKDSEDPAKENPQLNETLKTNYMEGQSKIEKLVQEFVSKQDTKGDGPEATHSDEESDESNYVDSEAEEEEKDK